MDRDNSKLLPSFFLVMNAFSAGFGLWQYGLWRLRKGRGAKTKDPASGDARMREAAPVVVGDGLSNSNFATSL